MQKTLDFSKVDQNSKKMFVKMLLDQNIDLCAFEELCERGTEEEIEFSVRIKKQEKSRTRRLKNGAAYEKDYFLKRNIKKIQQLEENMKFKKFMEERSQRVKKFRLERMKKKNAAQRNPKNKTENKDSNIAEILGDMFQKEVINEKTLLDDEVGFKSVERFSKKLGNPNSASFEVPSNGKGRFPPEAVSAKKKSKRLRKSPRGYRPVRKLQQMRGKDVSSSGASMVFGPLDISQYQDSKEESSLVLGRLPAQPGRMWTAADEDDSSFDEDQQEEESIKFVVEKRMFSSRDRFAFSSEEVCQELNFQKADKNSHKNHRSHQPTRGGHNLNRIASIGKENISPRDIPQAPQGPLNSIQNRLKESDHFENHRQSLQLDHILLSQNVKESSTHNYSLGGDSLAMRSSTAFNSSQLNMIIGSGTLNSVSEHLMEDDEESDPGAENHHKNRPNDRAAGRSLRQQEGLLNLGLDQDEDETTVQIIKTQKKSSRRTPRNENHSISSLASFQLNRDNRPTFNNNHHHNNQRRIMETRNGRVESSNPAVSRSNQAARHSSSRISKQTRPARNKLTHLMDQERQQEQMIDSTRVRATGSYDSKQPQQLSIVNSQSSIFSFSKANRGFKFNQNTTSDLSSERNFDFENSRHRSPFKQLDFSKRRKSKSSRNNTNESIVLLNGYEIDRSCYQVRGVGVGGNSDRVRGSGFSVIQSMDTDGGGHGEGVSGEETGRIEDFEQMKTRVYKQTEFLDGGGSRAEDDQDGDDLIKNETASFVFSNSQISSEIGMRAVDNTSSNNNTFNNMRKKKKRRKRKKKGTQKEISLNVQLRDPLKNDYRIKELQRLGFMVDPKSLNHAKSSPKSKISVRKAMKLVRRTVANGVDVKDRSWAVIGSQELVRNSTVPTVHKANFKPQKLKSSTNSIKNLEAGRLQANLEQKSMHPEASVAAVSPSTTTIRPIANRISMESTSPLGAPPAVQKTPPLQQEKDSSAATLERSFNFASIKMNSRSNSRAISTALPNSALSSILNVPPRARTLANCLPRYPPQKTESQRIFQENNPSNVSGNGSKELFLKDSVLPTPSNVVAPPPSQSQELQSNISEVFGNSTVHNSFVNPLHITQSSEFRNEKGESSLWKESAEDSAQQSSLYRDKSVYLGAPASRERLLKPYDSKSFDCAGYMSQSNPANLDSAQTFGENKSYSLHEEANNSSKNIYLAGAEDWFDKMNASRAKNRKESREQTRYVNREGLKELVKISRNNSTTSSIHRSRDDKKSNGTFRRAVAGYYQKDEYDHDADDEEFELAFRKNKRKRKRPKSRAKKVYCSSKNPSREVSRSREARRSRSRSRGQNQQFGKVVYRSRSKRRRKKSHELLEYQESADNDSTAAGLGRRVRRSRSRSGTQNQKNKRKKSRKKKNKAIERPRRDIDRSKGGSRSKSKSKSRSKTRSKSRVRRKRQEVRTPKVTKKTKKKERQRDKSGGMAGRRVIKRKGGYQKSILDDVLRMGNNDVLKYFRKNKKKGLTEF